METVLVIVIEKKSNHQTQENCQFRLVLNWTYNCFSCNSYAFLIHNVMIQLIYPYLSLVFVAGNVCKINVS